MPYYRRYSRRRKKRPYRRYRRGKNTLARKVNYLMKQNKVNRPQLSFYDHDATNEDIFTTPTVTAIKTHSSWGSLDMRSTLKSVHLRGKIALATEQNSNRFYRIVIFTDKSNEGSAVAWTDVYTSSDIFSHRKIDEGLNEGKRFRVLMDKTYKLIKDIDAQVNDAILINKYIKINIPSIWDFTNGRWEAGGLYIAFVGTSVTGAADFTYSIRTRSVPKTEINT